MSRIRHSSSRISGFACRGLSAALVAGLGMALSGAAARAADAPQIGVELNKLEAQAKGCRIYLLVDNPTATAFQSLKLDLALLKKDGTIDRRLAFDLAPLRPAKRSVKLFDADALACDGIGDVLVNDVLDCRAADAPVPDCLDRLKLSSRVGGVDLSK